MATFVKRQHALIYNFLFGLFVPLLTFFFMLMAVISMQIKMMLNSYDVLLVDFL